MAGFFRNGTFYGGSIPNGGSTGQALLKRTNLNGDVAWGDVSGITFTFIVGNTPFAADWLSLTPSGSALTPDAKFVYLILTEGDYYHNFVRWDSTNNTYLQISSGGTSTGGGAIFCTIDATKTAFDDDWLKDADNETIEPEAGLLYLVVTSGEFENAVFKFNETSEKYENVYQDLHFNTMPSPSAYYDGKIAQFTGTTSGSYTHGYFYECVNNSGTRSWVNRKVQDGEKTQATVMPTASVDLVGTIYQYTGETTALYTNGYFYECVADTSVSPNTYSWVEKAVQAGGSSSGGHEIKSGNTAFTQRDVLNLVDHDVSDDAENEETVVKPHLLTQAEWTDIFSNVPSGSDFGVLMDLRGERQVGRMIDTSGVIHAVYEQTFDITVPSAAVTELTEVLISVGSSVDMFIDLRGLIQIDGWWTNVVWGVPNLAANGLLLSAYDDLNLSGQQNKCGIMYQGDITYIDRILVIARYTKVVS